MKLIPRKITGSGRVLLAALLALAFGAACTAVAGPALTPKASAKAPLDLNAQPTDAQLNLQAGSVDGSAAVDLGGGGASATVTVNNDSQPKPPGDNGRHGGGDPGNGHDHGRAPVPEPALWIMLATLLGIGSVCASLERRKKRDLTLTGRV